jgi:hypothetical protein
VQTAGVGRPLEACTLGAVRLAGLGILSAVLLAACGSSSQSSTSPAAHTTPASAVSTTSSASGAPAPPAASVLRAAERPGAHAFPAARGRSLRSLSKLAAASVQLGAATGTFTPGDRRFAFALTDKAGSFLYAPTALYISRTPDAPAKGPFLAPADPMGVAPQYRSQENAGPGGIEAIYATRLPLPRAGTYTVLALTRTSRGLIGAPGEVAVAASSPIPDVGQRPPAIATDTAASVNGNTALLTTRHPPEQMAAVSLKQVLGKRPVALLFSTPQLCTSRVCGPVTDVAVAEQRAFGNRIAFIHQEVYVDNDPSKGLRPQLQAFHLRTEPWLFAINRHGVIVARLEGAFGTTELRAALRAALR